MSELALFRQCHEEPRMVRRFADGWVSDGAFGMKMKLPPPDAVDPAPGTSELFAALVAGKRREARERQGWRVPAGRVHDLGQVVVDVPKARLPILLAYRFAPLVDAAEQLCALPLLGQRWPLCVGMLDRAGLLVAFALPCIGVDVIAVQPETSVGDAP
jgi:hypothetical protein